MPEITFLPQNVTVVVEQDTKILAAARRRKLDIRFGCGACLCGTCAVKLQEPIKGHLSMMKESEKALLEKMNLSSSGQIRLACQTRIIDGAITVDLDFQDTYSPID